MRRLFRKEARSRPPYLRADLLRAVLTRGAGNRFWRSTPTPPDNAASALQAGFAPRVALMLQRRALQPRLQTGWACGSGSSAGTMRVTGAESSGCTQTPSRGSIRGMVADSGSGNSSRTGVSQRCSARRPQECVQTIPDSVISTACSISISFKSSS